VRVSECAQDLRPSVRGVTFFTYPVKEKRLLHEFPRRRFLIAVQKTHLKKWSGQRWLIIITQNH
uniref:Uncharacterized protein n=1 Tax=Anopheles dirus TaxID=7168 RepID=A0A182NBM1_9DIPT